MNVDVAVIPAAGRGTRMRPATRAVPKAFLPVVDRPAIQWIIEEGIRAGAHEFVVVVDPGVDELLRRHMTVEEGLEGFEDITVHPVVQQVPRGLGDAVLQARN
ncbi:MAG: sugar phosphate nucleotidyltransferase, partial [Acidimicrobiia bacterium]